MGRSDELPDHGAVGEALKRLLCARGNRPVSARQGSRLLAERFALSSKQLVLVIQTAAGTENAWYNRCRTARNDLVRDGVMNRGPRDSWSLTARAYKGLTATAEELGL
jgi:hypothetical protein